MIRNLLKYTCTLLLCGGLSGSSVQAKAVNTQAFYFGGDVSALPLFESWGAEYYNADGIKGDALEIMSDAGMNLFRLRVFVNPTGKRAVVNDLEYTLSIAKRIADLEADILIDFHYSDTWADPGHQIIPKAWEGLGLEELSLEVEKHSHRVIAALVDQGTVPKFIQVGNEITGGMLWPLGKLEHKGNVSESWTRLAVLLNAGLRGCRSALPHSADTEFMLHIERPQHTDRVLRWYRNALLNGVDFDLIGLSYYPKWHDDTESLVRTLEALAAEFSQRIMIVETGYPYLLLPRWRDKEYLHWPVTPVGQFDFLEEIIRLVTAVPNGKGIGVCYWHPESIQVEAQKSVWQGGSCSLFDKNGKVLPAMDVLNNRDE